MSKLFFTVGPSKVFPTIESHLAHALTEQVVSISHRSEAFDTLFASTVSRLRKLLGIPETHEIFFLSSGTEAMERALENCVERVSFHFVSGAFSERFYKTAAELGKQPLRHDIGDNLADLSSPVPEHVEMICITQNETSNGMQFPIEKIYDLKKQYPEKLLAVDIVSAIPYVSLDYSHIDIAFFSVQKGFGLPAGLGVMIVSPAALKKSETLREKGISTGTYHSFAELCKYAKKSQTPETPNVLGIYLLNAVLGDMLTKGIEAIREETKAMAEKLYTYFEANSDRFTPFVRTPELRSTTTLSIEVTGGSAPLIQKLKAEGIVLASGYKEHKESQIRIANFPSLTKEDFGRLFSALS